MSEWQDISAAPLHTEVLAYREDAGVFYAIYTSLDGMLSDGEIERSNLTEEEIFEVSWFCFDICGLDRLDGDLMPTHWMPLPPPPSI